MFIEDYGIRVVLYTKLEQQGPLLFSFKALETRSDFPFHYGWDLIDCTGKVIRLDRYNDPAVIKLRDSYRNNAIRYLKDYPSKYPRWKS
jgi:hypothetical protein